MQGRSFQCFVKKVLIENPFLQLKDEREKNSHLPLCFSRYLSFPLVFLSCLFSYLWLRLCMILCVFLFLLLLHHRTTHFLALALVLCRRQPLFNVHTYIVYGFLRASVCIVCRENSAECMWIYWCMEVRQCRQDVDATIYVLHNIVYCLICSPWLLALFLLLFLSFQRESSFGSVCLSPFRSLSLAQSLAMNSDDTTRSHSLYLCT